MITSKEINEAKNKLKIEKDALQFSQNAEKFFKTIFGVGLSSLAYLGFRSFIGPDVDVYAKQLKTTLQQIDVLEYVSFCMCGIAGGLAYGFAYLDKKSSEKNFEKTKSELEKLIKEN